MPQIVGPDPPWYNVQMSTNADKLPNDAPEPLDYEAWHAGLAKIPDEYPPAPARANVGGLLSSVASVSSLMLMPFLAIAALVGGTTASIWRSSDRS